MTSHLSRLLQPRTVAVIGGGAWCRSVIEELARFGPDITVWHVHPRDKNSVYKGVLDLPEAPDAAFIGINREATVAVVQDLAKMGAGGAVCFASGFSEVADGGQLNAALLTAAGEMPILGPNCYGFINALDRTLLWPDQHGSTPVESGVAILTQSSNIAINLTMQKRALPIAYMVTCGNQAQTSQAQIAMALLDDRRVTAIGLHVEGFGSVHEWQALARAAKARNIPLVAMKVGRSEAAQTAAISHTASLAGQDAGAQALMDRLGIARVDDLPTFLETLKLLHVTGPLPSGNVATISCSGGEASLAADLATGTQLQFPPLNARQLKDLSAALGPKVALANPLDYHTYIWRDVDAMTDAFSAMLDPDLALTMLIVDFPRSDRCSAADWESAIAAAITAKARTGGNIAMVATLPECMPEDAATRLIAAGVVPILGLVEALKATEACVARPTYDLDIDLPHLAQIETTETLTEAEAKAAFSGCGIQVPRSISTTEPGNQHDLKFPLVLKGQGIAHKTEHGAVALGLNSTAEIANAAAEMPAEVFLIEEMVTGAIAELLIGITRDPAHGLLLTVGAGGTMTELLDDTVSLLVPSSDVAIEQALTRLKCAKLLSGFRGRPPAHLASVVAAIMALQDYALANVDHLAEAEVNPLICTKDAAIAADALIRIAYD